MLSIKATLQIFGWILVFLFPLGVVYLTGGVDKEPLLDDVEYRRREEKKRQLLEKQKAKEQQQQPAATPAKKKNNKKKQQQQQPVEQAQPQQAQPQNKKKKNNKKQAAPKQEPVKQEVLKKEEPVKEEPAKEEKADEPVKEIDEHMDPTVNYARVMRIKPEEVEEEYDPVPAEDGWSQVKTRRPAQTTRSSSSYVDNNAALSDDAESSSRYIPGLDKKQRENMKRNAKKKEQKAQAAALQDERLRKHQKEQEKARIQEFYSSGKGKNTPWGKNGSSKRPTSTASINEHGQLIWD